VARTVPAHFYDQSSAVPIVGDGEGVRLVLVTSRKGKRWTFPKGVIEPNLTPQESAAQEALEEAGVLGEINAERIGSYTYEKWGGTCTVQVFGLAVLRVLDEWQEADVRERRIVPPAEAWRLLNDKTVEALARSLIERR
jgi:8-oxo-dGTP pyrophosphatase MutT (NUDIX family)